MKTIKMIMNEDEFFALVAARVNELEIKGGYKVRSIDVESITSTISDSDRLFLTCHAYFGKTILEKETILEFYQMIFTFEQVRKMYMALPKAER